MKIERNWITRRFEFDAGHRVLGHEGKCRHLHGHRYCAEVSVTARSLDDLGRVVDFSVLKEKVGEWIDSNWDHNMILHADDPLLLASLLHDLHTFSEPLPFIMPSYAPNPTVENMVKVLFYELQEVFSDTGVTLAHIRLYETPNCWATWGAVFNERDPNEGDNEYDGEL